jgi:CheY-like chemotaxis protein
MINQVLCVDDDDITLLLNKLVIKKAEFSTDIVTAINGKDALDFYESIVSKGEISIYPEFIFLDINMPILSGWEFLDRFLISYYSHFPNTRVVILSSSVNPEDYEKARQYDIVIDFYSKPLSKDQLEKLMSVQKS